MAKLGQRVVRLVMVAGLWRWSSRRKRCYARVRLLAGTTVALLLYLVCSGLSCSVTSVPPRPGSLRYRVQRDSTRRGSTSLSALSRFTPALAWSDWRSSALL